MLAPGVLRWDHDISLVRYVTAAPLEPVYTECQCQCCNGTCSLIATPFWSNSIVTTRKRSLGQGNVFTGICHSFCPQGGLHPGGGLHLRGCASGGLHPEGVCLQWGLGRPCPSTTGYNQQAGGTHPTGIHSCFQ